VPREGVHLPPFYRRVVINIEFTIRQISGTRGKLSRASWQALKNNTDTPGFLVQQAPREALNHSAGTASRAR